MFTAQIAGADETPMGLNAPGAEQNAQLLLNVAHWLSGLFDEAEAPVGLKTTLARAAGAASFAALKDEMNATAEKVRALFTELIEEEAKGVPGGEGPSH